MATRPSGTQQLGPDLTPAKQQQSHVWDQQQAPCPHGSPVSGLCSSAAASARPFVGPQSDSTISRYTHSNLVSVRTGSLFGLSQPAANWHCGKGPTSTLSWAPGASAPLTSSTSSMPELWQRQATERYSAGRQTPDHQPNTADSTPSRDQLLRTSQPHPMQPLQQHAHQPAGGLNQMLSQQQQGQWVMPTQKILQQQPAASIDVLLAPLLPSADQHKVLERLSQLRQALEEQRRLTVGWEQQAVSLQQTVLEGQHENLTMRGQLVALQHNINLLGGNLQGRLSMVQGAVLTQLQSQLAEKDAALAGSEQILAGLQSEVERLSCRFDSKLAAEQSERERLSAEASQARLLCQARGRQLTELQQQLQQLQQTAATQEQTASARAELEQQQAEQLHQKVQQLEQELCAAQQAAVYAGQQVSAVEGGKNGLQQQVDELQSALAEKHLQIEWLEGKIADLENSDMASQMKRHSSEVSRLQAAAAAERQAAEQQLRTLQMDLKSLQQQDQQREQQLQSLEQDKAMLQEQIEQQQQAADAQIGELQRLLQEAEADVPQLQAELQHLAAGASAGQAAAAAAAAADQDSSWQQQQQQERDVLAAAMASDTEDTDNGHDRLVICHQEGLTISDTAQSRPTTPAAAAMEHALRAELGMANAEVARLRHELDVARAASKEERHLTGVEIMRLQQELSEAAVSASSTGAAAAAAGDDEVTSQLPVQQQQLEGCRNSSSNSWHSVHENPAFEQQQQQGYGAATAETAPTAARADLVSQYEGRLQDQSQTIASLQQQLKQQQHLLATLRKPERRVHDSAASRSSWVDMLGPDEDTRHHLAAAAAAGQQLLKPLIVAADAAVQTDAMSTESAGSTAAVAAADDQVEFMSPRHSMSKQQQQAAGAGDVWCEGAAGSALLSAARQEMQRLQELNQHLLESHAEDMKSSVSFEAARRALIEAKSHAKSKAAAVLQANNKAWQDKLTAAKGEQQQLMQQVEELTQQRDRLLTQVCASSQYESAVGHLQQQLDASQDHIHQLQHQIAALTEQHAQELEQVRMELETEAAAAMLDAGAVAVRRSMQQQQDRREAAVQVALQMQPLLLDIAVQTDQHQCQLWRSEVMVVPQVLQQQQNDHSAVAEAKQQQLQDKDHHHRQKQLEVQQDDRGGPSAGDRQQHQQQEELPAVSLTAERPATPQPAPATPGAAAAAAPPPSAAIGLDAAADSHMAAAASTPSTAAAANSAAAPAVAAAGSAAATTGAAAAANSAVAATAAANSAVAAIAAAAAGSAGTAATPAAAYVKQWQQQHAADAADDDMCRMSSASDTPASHSSKIQFSRVRSSGSLPRQPAVAAAGVSSSSEFGDCSSNYKCCEEGASGACRSQAVGSRPSSAGNLKLPELQTSSSPITASCKPALMIPQQGLQAHQDVHQQQRDQTTFQQQQQPAVVGGSTRLSDWHVELLQQQAQLDQLRMRLSQHKCLTPPLQQQQRKFSGVSSFLDRQVSPQRLAAAGSVLGNSSSTVTGAAGSAAPSAGVGYSRPVCAAATGAAAATLGSSVRAESPLLEPVAGGNSPLTWTQRRQQRQQEQQPQQQYTASPGASTWNPLPSIHTNQVYEATPSSSSSGYGAFGANSVASTAAAAETAAAYARLGQYGLQYGTADARYTSTETWQTEDRVLTGDSASLTRDVRRTYTNSLYQEQDVGPAAAGDGGTGSTFSLGHAGVAAAGGSTSVRPVLHAPSMATNNPTNMTMSMTAAEGTGSSLQDGNKNVAEVGFEGATYGASQSPGSTPVGNGLGKIHDDVMGALSLSRYHRDRSKQQEARAKQHAVNAQDALDRAAAVRSSRLSGAAADATSGISGISATSIGMYGSSSSNRQ